MEAIVEKLRVLGLLDDDVVAELAALWKYGVEAVSDAALRAALVDFLENETPLFFFVGPASLTGKHHPSWQTKKSGLLRNTVECCVALNRQLQAYPEFTDAQCDVIPVHRDIVLVATILSDTYKYFERKLDAAPRLDPEHGRKAAEKWLIVADTHGVPIGVRADVYEAIYWHLGRWTPGWQPDKQWKAYVDITHRVDMFMSDNRLDLLYDPKPRINGTTKGERTVPEPNVVKLLEAATNEEFERAKVCYSENCQTMRSLNQIMWQAPIIAMTLTGGLWYGVASLKTIDVYVKCGILVFVGVADLLLIFVVQRVRSVMEAYLVKIKDFHPRSYADAKSGQAVRWLRERGVANTFCVLLSVASLMSFLGLFRIGITSADVPSGGASLAQPIREEATTNAIPRQSPSADGSTAHANHASSPAASSIGQPDQRDQGHR